MKKCCGEPTWLFLALQIIFWLIYWLCPSIVLANDGEKSFQWGVRGFVDTYHALQSKKPNNWMSSRTRIRGELSLSHGYAGAYVSANLLYNAVLPEKSGFQLREVYALYANSHLDIRGGRQIIAWGVADGLRLTDVISPMDYTEFLAQDYDDIRIPVGALRIRYGNERYAFDVVAVPVPSFFELPSGEQNPWSMGILPDTEEPKHRIYNSEYGARFSAYLSGIDFSVAALHTWQKTPVFYQGRWCYRRMGLLGGDVSVPVRQVVLRSEVASYLFNEGSTLALLGCDWYIPGNWMLSTQFLSQLRHRKQGIPDPLSGQEYQRHTMLGTFRLSKDLCNNTLQLQTFAYVDITYGGVFNRASVDYAVSDQVHLLLGYDYLDGQRGSFAPYRHNSEIWMKAKYSF